MKERKKKDKIKIDEKLTMEIQRTTESQTAIKSQKKHEKDGNKMMYVGLLGRKRQRNTTQFTFPGIYIEGKFTKNRYLSRNISVAL